MKHARLLFSDSEFVLRQTPGGRGFWDSWSFACSSSAAPSGFAAAAVYEQLREPVRLNVDPSRLVFITGEPESIRQYNPRFLAQFSAVLTSRSDIEHKNVIQSQPAIPWWAGVACAYPHKNRAVLGFDDFAALSPASMRKTKLLSIVCSKKAMTPGHRRRLETLEKLKAHFGDQLDVFGNGFADVPDKWSAIADYKYHLAIENSAFPHYWTEKIADAFLGLSMPLYWGCPNIADYFPRDSFRLIDRDNPAAAIHSIEAAIRDDAFGCSLNAIVEARRRLLFEFNVFPTLVRIFEGRPQTPIRSVVLRPEIDFTGALPRRVARRLKRKIRSWFPS